MIFWRRGRESNPSKRLCRPLHNLFATSPEALTKKGSQASLLLNSGAGEESRTLDLNLGKVALYQLSYSRIGAIILNHLHRFPAIRRSLEREKSLELSTSTLARLRSTN